MVLLTELLSLWVAPHVGAWIETEDAESCCRPDVSRPTWARGLKQHS